MLAERMLTNKELAEMPGKEPATMAKFLEATVDGLTQIGHSRYDDNNFYF